MNTIMNLIVAYVMNGVTSYILHSIAYRVAVGKYKIKIFGNNKSCIFNILSLDYYFADAYKFFIKKECRYCLYKSKLAYFIERSNYFNLILSVILLFIVHYIAISKIRDSNLLNIFKYYALIRCISRSIEIIVAFYKDVVYKKKKKSSLKSGERISLAVKSYIDIIIMYASIYMLNIVFGNQKIIYNMVRSFGVSSFTQVDYLNQRELYMLVISLQVVTSMVLVIFSIARYIGEVD